MGPSGLTPVQARVLEHLHEVVQKLDSIDLPGHKQWLGWGGSSCLPSF